MSRKMHAQWKDFHKPQMANKRTNNKLFNVDEYDVANLNVPRNNKSINSDLYQAVFPIYHISKLTGVFPTRFVRQVSGRYQGRLSIVDSIYSLLLLALLIGIEIWAFWLEVRCGWEYSIRLKSKTTVFTTSIDVLGVISVTAASIIGSILYWQHVRTVIDKLVECDKKMGILSPKKLQRVTIISTSVCLSYTIIASSLDIYALWKYEIKQNKELYDVGPIKHLPLYLMYIIHVMMQLQFAIIVYNVGQRFFRLNKNLENILQSSKITNQFMKDVGLAGDIRDQEHLITYIQQEMMGNTQLFRKSKIMDSTGANDNGSFMDKISRLLAVHSSLCDTISLINDAYGVVILIITLACITHLVIAPSFLILEPDRMREPLFFTVETLWCVFHTSKLLGVVQPTYATTMQGKKTAVLVSQLLSESHDREGTRKLEIFSLQLLHRPVIFSVCGLFTLDRTLITSIVGAVTTYLVLMVQFQNEDDKKLGFDNIVKNAMQILKNATTFHNFTAGKLGL
ncbi:gustatory receptor for sugar taste 43a-like [Nylanderia fulva]|uniref:gustatory receptor for sugar taste 43a-like n=1 Tax=Nylanderia fulva TaxID=613905 RepID=UPI0010FBB7B4|nr:gustatory receptor for sugar taste 43a-like [Nylanderia fulva]